MTIAIAIPEKRFLSREEAAEWLGVCVDTFTGFGIDYVDLGPRNRRWDIFDIINFAEDNKRCDSARTSDKRRRQTCVSISEPIHRAGGSPGTTSTESAIAEVLELPTGS